MHVDATRSGPVLVCSSDCAQSIHSGDTGVPSISPTAKLRRWLRLPERRVRGGSFLSSPSARSAGARNVSTWVGSAMSQAWCAGECDVDHNQSGSVAPLWSGLWFVSAHAKPSCAVASAAPCLLEQGSWFVKSCPSSCLPPSAGRVRCTRIHLQVDCYPANQNHARDLSHRRSICAMTVYSPATSSTHRPAPP